LTDDQLIERVDLPGVVEVAGQWYGVTDSGRTLHVVVGEVRIGVRAVCGQKVDREAVPLDGVRLCRRCGRLTAPSVSTNVRAEHIR